MPQTRSEISSTSRSQATSPQGEPLGGQHGKRSDAETLEQAHRSLLARYPQAPVAALEPAGVLVRMPDSIQLAGNTVLEARSGLDLIVDEDRVPVLDTWDRILAEGTGRCRVHLVASPQEPVSFYGFDLREVHGVILAVYVPAGPDDAPVAAPRPVQVGRTLPRFASIRKDDRSFIIKVDQAITEILGWSAEEMVGRRSLEFIHPDDRSMAIDNWMDMLASGGMGRRIRLRHRRRDDSWVWFEVTNHSLIDDPDHSCVITEMVDISEEMAAQEALGAREQLLARLAETIPIGLFQIDTERRVTYTNERLNAILGVDLAAGMTDLLSTVVDANGVELEKALDGVLDHGVDSDIEVELHLPGSHELRFCTVNLRALRHKDGTISGAIACVADVTDGVRLREELENRATFDRLTGCYNRESIMVAVEANIACGGEDADRAVMFIDLDCFKQVNDKHGHAAGDELLRNVAKRLQSSLRHDNLIGRIGGDEFLILCPGIGGPDQALRLATRLLQAVRRDSSLETLDVEPSASIGVAWSRGHGGNADALVAQADRAMYASKHDGAGRPRLAQ